MSKVLAQDAYELVLSDLHGGSLPGALLFSGKEFSGKLTAALDVADAMFGGRSFWQGSPDFLLLGHRDCCLEIAAFARRLESSPGGESLLLFLDSVRKLSLRFSQVLWDGDDSAKKFAQVLEELDGDVGALKSQSDPEKIGKLCASILKSCEKLEGDFLYESVPIDQIRNMASWAHDRPNFTKKVVVIENAELMLESARNSLLKILEEPPRDVLFILTTSNRGAVMQTILSRVRTYQFTERAASVESEILSSVFGVEGMTGIADYVRSFLPVAPSAVREIASRYYGAVCAGQIPSASSVVDSCAKFKPRFLFSMFLKGIMDSCGNFARSPRLSAVAFENARCVRECWNAVSVYNQSPLAAIEHLTKELSLVQRIMRPYDGGSDG